MYAALFMILGAMLAWSACNTATWFAIPMFWTSLCLITLSVAYGFLGARVFLKNAGGRLSFMSYLIFGPYFLLNSIVFLFYRLSTREDPWNEIVPGVFLGRKLGASDRTGFEALKIHAVLDVTSEFSECEFVRHVAQYRCIPTLDTRAPTLAELTAGAAFIADSSGQGNVYVHCALGHGRSATFVTAFLLKSGKAPSLVEAIELIRKARPGVRISPSQMRLLETLALS